MNNLFSHLNEQQINSLTKEQRDQLYAIDQVLFPDEDTHTERTNLYQDWLKRTEAAEADRQQYKEQLEQSFAR